MHSAVKVPPPHTEQLLPKLDTPVEIWKTCGECELWIASGLCKAPYIVYTKHPSKSCALCEPSQTSDHEMVELTCPLHALSCL